MKNIHGSIIKGLLGLIFSLVMLLAATSSITSQMLVASSATTYTRTVNSDGLVIRCQDGYLPETTFDRIGLDAPQDMVTDVVVENGKEVEYAYVLNQGKNAGAPFITKFDINDVANTVTTISIGSTLPYIKEPTGLWIRTTTVKGITRKELYIADAAATYNVVVKATDLEKSMGISDYSHTYTGLVYRVQFNQQGTELLLDSNNVTIIHEPSEEAPRNYDNYEVLEYLNDETIEAEKLKDRKVIATNETNFESLFNKKGAQYKRTIVCKIGHEDECDRIVPIGKFIMKTSSFGQSTVFRPRKVSVDDSGNMFIASEGTSAGMIQLSYSGEFVSFYVVNNVSYDFLYQFIRNFGTQAQLDKLVASTPPSFSNVFIDKENLVYSVTKNHTTVFDKYSTGGSSILETPIRLVGLNTSESTVTDSFVTDQGLIFLITSKGMIYVFAPNGTLIFYFGTYPEGNVNTDIVGIFNNLESIIVDDNNRIWVIDSGEGCLQTFVPTNYANCIISAITSFNEQKYEESRSYWEQVLQYDSLSVLGNDGLGKAYYYDQNYEESLKYFAVSKNRTLYSNVFWERRNDFIQDNLGTILIIALVAGLIIVGLNVLFKHNKRLRKVKDKAANIKNHRWFKDLTVGFRLIVKPNDTFYEMKSNRRGSVWGATIHYILAIVAFMLNTYCYALPFQYVTTNSLSPSVVLCAVIAVLAVFVLCNYLVSAINDGEGTFKDIYKFTGYCLLPMILCLPVGVAISYILTLNEQIVLTLLKMVGFWGSGILLVIGVLETHNYTFTQTVKNILLTVVFMILFAIVCVVVVVMIDQIKTFIETVWKEVKLRVGWY